MWQLRGATLAAGGVGVLLLSPWWLSSWQAWDEACRARVRLEQEQASVYALRAQTAQIESQANPSHAPWASATTLNELAHLHGLHVSQLSVGKPESPAALQALQRQQQTVHIAWHGAWGEWLAWLTQWPTAAPGVTVASLELQADPHAGMRAQMGVRLPQALVDPHTTPPIQSHTTVVGDPFNHHRWTQAQHTYAAQHPSFARLVLPELARPRDFLETLARERLQYVGHLSWHNDIHALLKVQPLASDKPDPASTHVHRVRVGSHLGQDFGRVLAIAPDHLLLQELVLMPTGEWQTRNVRLPLQESTP